MGGFQLNDQSRDSVLLAFQQKCFKKFATQGAGKSFSDSSRKLSARCMVWFMRFFMAALLSANGFSAFAQPDFLPPEEAFRISIELLNESCETDCRADVRIVVADDYYLYRERFNLDLGDELASAEFVDLPRGTKKYDEFLGQEIEALRGSLAFSVSYSKAADSDRKTVGSEVKAASLVSQGCADAGLCYPPMETMLLHQASSGFAALSAMKSSLGSFLGKDKSSVAVSSLATDNFSGESENRPNFVNENASSKRDDSSQDDAGLLANRLASEPLFIVLPIFFGLGLLLAFTPCTLPMLPIVTSLVVGQNSTSKQGGKPLALAMVYVFGMALTYAGLGVLAGLSGQSLVMAMQQRAVLWTFGALLALLGVLLLKGVSLQMPVGVQNWIQEKTGKMKGGQFLPVLIMGFLSALLIGPCVAPPLAGALLYIGQTGDALTGGAALFLLALGMGLPIVLFAAGAGHLLPKAGAWMHSVSVAFGFLLLATALWLIGPVTPLVVMFGLWVLWLALVAASLTELANSTVLKTGFAKVLSRGLALIASLFALIYTVGLLTSAPSLLTPLHQLTGGGVAIQATNLRKFELVSSDEINGLLSSSSQPIMLDFYADWCVACKEFEVLTFPDPRVQKGLEGIRLLKVDVTENSASDQALLKQFGLFGPPAILFFELGGEEIKAQRVVGFQSAERFDETLTEVRGALGIGR